MSMSTVVLEAGEEWIPEEPPPALGDSGFASVGLLPDSQRSWPWEMLRDETGAENHEELDIQWLQDEEFGYSGGSWVLRV
jgi:hypothetical protein